MGNSFYLDASSLAKRYVPEPGSAQVHVILDTVAHARLHLLNIGAGEIVSILVRKRNSGTISQAYFAQALANFQTEIVHARDITKVPVTSRLITASFPLIVAHSINSTDAITSNRRWLSPGACVPRAMTWCWLRPTNVFCGRPRPRG